MKRRRITLLEVLDLLVVTLVGLALVAAGAAGGHRAGLPHGAR